jgi:AraC-like DNA-binding protein
VWLSSSALLIEDIVSHVGYRDVSSFTRMFQQHVGSPPGEYRRRVQHDARPRIVLSNTPACRPEA